MWWQVTFLADHRLVIVGVSAPGYGEAPGSRAFDQDRSASTQGLQVLFYRAALPLSCQTLTFVSGLVRAHRREIGSVWRALNPGQQALLALVYRRKGRAVRAGRRRVRRIDHDVLAVCQRAVELLAARAPKLRGALRAAKRKGYAYVIIDGTLIPIDRIAADRPFYPGRHKRHG
jgi:hypothetical protein